MSLFITSLNSGSNGNCYYIGNETEAVLIDAGISCREIEKRMKRLHLPAERVKAVFISHEHTDHIKGVEVFVKKFQVPVFITKATLQSARLQLDPHLVNSFSHEGAILIGKLKIIPFKKFHDACDPYSFVISENEVCVGVFTDIGTVCDQLKKYFSRCHAAFLETNYDEKMLETGNYPFHLKRRIRGGMGHLSNTEALDLFLSHRSGFLSLLLLSHLSKNNNSRDLVEELFTRYAGSVRVIVTSRDTETELFPVQEIQNTITISKKRFTVANQLTLFPV